MDLEPVLKFVWETGSDMAITAVAGYGVGKTYQKISKRLDTGKIRKDYMKIMGLEGDYFPFIDIALNQIIENIKNYKELIRRTQQEGY